MIELPKTSIGREKALRELLDLAERIVQPLITTKAVADYHAAFDELVELVRQMTTFYSISENPTP